MVEHDGLWWFKPAALSALLLGIPVCSKGAGSQPSATPFNSWLAWIKMVMEVRKTKLVVTKHHPIMLKLSKAAKIFL